MTIGKLEYSPDYKSDKKSVTIRFRQFRHKPTGAVISRPEAMGTLSGEWEELPNWAERARLERQIVEAAMKRHRAQSDYSDETYRGAGEPEKNILHQADCDLRVATLALEQFEAQQK